MKKSDTIEQTVEKETEVKQSVKYIFLTEQICELKVGYDGIDKVTVNDPTGFINGIQFSIQGAISGCGLCIMNGNSMFASYSDDKLAAIGEAMKQYVTQMKVNTQSKGCILATLGNNRAYKLKDEYMLKMGFKLINEYENIAHGLMGTDTQRIYALNITRDEVKNRNKISK